MAEVTYIIPIHKLNKEMEPLFLRAVQSIANQDTRNDVFAISIVGPSAVLKKAKKIVEQYKIQAQYVQNDGETDPFTQINLAVEQCETRFFSVLEYDDEITPIWTRNALKYEEDNSVLLPLTELLSAGAAISYANELAWDASFGIEENIGKINLEMLKTYMDFIVSGAFINTEDFRAVGGLKPSMKIAAWYEFLLRCCYKNKGVYVVPKLGYLHNVDTNGSYSEEAKKAITPEEGAWLIKTANQEYFFKVDRKKKFGE